MRAEATEANQLTRRQLLKAASLGGMALYFIPRTVLGKDAEAPKPTPLSAEKDLLVHLDAPWNAEPALAHLVDSWITPVKYFYVRCNGPIPQLDAKSFVLSIEGLVHTPLKIKVADLEKEYPQVTAAATLTCAGNRREEQERIKPVGGVPWKAGAIGNAEWGGVNLAHLLKAAGLKPEAKHVWFEGVDKHDKKGEEITFGGSVPINKALASGSTPGVILATKMNGQPLLPEHGYPLRAVVPGYIGARSVKWLNRIIVSDKPSDNHYVSHAYKLIPEDTTANWEAAAPLYENVINAVVCVPASGAQVPVGKLRVQGYALPTGKRKSTITRVEVSTDGGSSWLDAQLTGFEQPFCWRLWQADVPITAQTQAILVRATDSTGAVQPAEPVWNAKGYQHNAWHKAGVKPA